MAINFKRFFKSAFAFFKKARPVIEKIISIFKVVKEELDEDKPTDKTE